MRIASWSIILVCLVNLVRGQSEAEDNRTEVIGDREWWSERITKIDKKETQPIGLARQDNEETDRRWRGDEEIGDSRRRPRPFASVVQRVPEIRDRDFHRFESQRQKARNRSFKNPRVFRFERPSPSPILLPPFDFPSPVYRNNFFDNEAPSPWSNESSSHAGKSDALERPRINEITTFKSANNEPVESKPSSRDDDSTRTIGANNDDRWIDFARETFVNDTRTSTEKSIQEAGRNNPGSFYIDEELENNRPKSSTVAPSRSNLLKKSRGNRKYQHDGFESERTFARKRTFSPSGRNDWQRRPTQRSNHFRFSDDPNGKVGAVPGVPGRDYPVHQEHTHHHLRNVVDRFPCPQNTKNQVYLADRASRCQIFYVCYGSNTGVPMVCPNGTLFSEPLQVCDWWFNVVC